MTDPGPVRNAEPPPGATAVTTPADFTLARRSSFLIPSVGDLIFILLLVSLAAGPLAQKLLGDAGIGWHIRAGDLILKTGSVPRLDPFSSTMGGQAWYAWEWLYDLIVGGVHDLTGLNGVVFFNAFIIALTFLVVFRKMLSRGAGMGAAVGLLLLTVTASSIHFLARPHVVSWLLTVIWFGLLAAFEDDGRARRLIWLPAIMLAWVNLHGGFLVGLALVAIYWLAECAKSVGLFATDNRAAAARKAKTLTIAGAITAAATFVNPYGYQLHLHIYRYLGDRFLMDHIDEFLSPNFHGIAQKCFAGILLLTLLGLSLSPKRPKASELMVIAFAVYTGLYATRSIPVSSMLLALVMALYLSASFQNWWSSLVAPIRTGWAQRFQGLSMRTGTVESRLRGHLWPILAVLLGIWLCAQEGYLGKRQVMNAHFDAKRFPVAAVDWLTKSNLRDPVFCPDSWGGYLIYRRYPDARPAVDDRHDLYGSEFFKNYLKIMRVEPGWETALREMHTSWILAPDGSPLATLLREVPQWRLVYHDETTAVFTLAPH